MEFLNICVVLEETCSLCSAFLFSLPFSGAAPVREGKERLRCSRVEVCVFHQPSVTPELGVPHNRCAGRQHCTDGAGGLFLLFGND